MAELETRWRDLGEFIREQRRIGHLSLRKLSEMAGISNPYLSQIERGLRKPSAEILQQIARALEISSETLYVRAGILEAHDGETDLVAEIRRDQWLSEEQKKTLVQIYESFRSERRAAGFGPLPIVLSADADLAAEDDDQDGGGAGGGAGSRPVDDPDGAAPDGAADDGGDGPVGPGDARPGVAEESGALAGRS